MAEPTYVNCPTTCTITVVHELALPPMQIDEAGAGALAGAIIAVWALGWAIRTLIRVLRDTDKLPETLE